MHFPIDALLCFRLHNGIPEASNGFAFYPQIMSMGESQQYGSIAKGKVANFFITRPIPSVSFVPYAYTTPIVERVFLGGKEC